LFGPRCSVVKIAGAFQYAAKYNREASIRRDCSQGDRPAARTQRHFGVTIAMSARIRCGACNAQWPATTSKCYKCGQVLGPGGSTASDVYLSDALSRDSTDQLAKQLLRTQPSGAFCDGNKLMMVEGCEMPRRCPVCNSEEVFESTELTLSRETKEMGGVSGLIKAGADALAGWDYTGPVEVSVYFCDRHRNRFRNRLITAVGILAASLLYLLFAYFWHKNRPGGEYYDVIAAVIGAIGATVMLAIWGKSPALVWFKPRRFVDRTVWVTGACRPFLESLPRAGQSRR
jgi:hypothetical protein